MMSRLILFTILIAAFASTQPNKTAYGQDEFQPAFARTLEQAIDPSVLETERSLAVPERVRPKRLPAAQVKSTPRLPSRQLAEQFYAPSISNSNIYRSPTQPRKPAVERPVRFAKIPTPLLPVQLPSREQRESGNSQVDPTWPRQSAALPKTTKLSDMDVSLMELPADESNEDSLTVGSYLLSDQSLGQPKLPTESKFGTVMMFRAGEATKELSFPRAEKMAKNRFAPPRNLASSNQLAPVEKDQRGTTFNFASSPLNAANPIGFIPPANSVIAKPSSSVAPTPTPPARIQSLPVTATLGDSPPMNDQPESNTTRLGNANSLTTTVIGPESLAPNVPGVFEIIVTNESGVSTMEVVVQFNVSEDVTITKLDRNAWLDDENRKVSWKVTEIPAGQNEIIRFSAVCETPGVFQQSIRLGANRINQGTTYFDTTVVQPSR